MIVLFLIVSFMIFVIVYSYQADEFIEKYFWVIVVVLLLAGVVGLGVRG